MRRNSVLLAITLSLLVIIFLTLPDYAIAKAAKEVEETVIEEIPPLKGPKKTIGVLSFENKSSFAGELALGTEFSEMLTEALMKSGQFVVVARQELGAVIAEQDMAASTRFAKSEAAQKGKLIPAQIIVKGAVTEFDSQTKSGSGGVSVGNLGFGNIGLSSQSAQAHVAVIVYIIDSTTGQVLDSQRVEGRAKSGGIGVDYGFRNWVSLSGSDFRRTPLGKATQITIKNAVNYIADRLAGIPWSGSVVKVEGNTVYLNAGSEAGLVSGDMFNVFREDEALVDPVTGMSLGSEKTKIASVVVNEVKPKYSKANISNASSQIVRGDIVTE